MNFKKAVLKAREMESVIITDEMGIRRIDENEFGDMIIVQYELKLDDKAVYFNASHIPRIGDYVVRKENGVCFLVPKAQYEQNYYELDPCLTLEVTPDNRHVRVYKDRLKDSQRLIVELAKPIGDDWFVRSHDDMATCDLEHACFVMAAMRAAMRAAKEIDPNLNL
jgi:hypothetical protein